MKTVCFDCAKCKDVCLIESQTPEIKGLFCHYIYCERGKEYFSLMPRVECPDYEEKQNGKS